MEMEIELETVAVGGVLPQPATNPKPLSSFSLRRLVRRRGDRPGLRDGNVVPTFHSKASTIAFALCFSESCILFVLVVFQAVDAFTERYVPAYVV